MKSQFCVLAKKFNMPKIFKIFQIQYAGEALPDMLQEWTTTYVQVMMGKHHDFLSRGSLAVNISYPSGAIRTRDANEITSDMVKKLRDVFVEGKLNQIIGEKYNCDKFFDWFEIELEKYREKAVERSVYLPLFYHDSTIDAAALKRFDKFFNSAIAALNIDSAYKKEIEIFDCDSVKCARDKIVQYKQNFINKKKNPTAEEINRFFKRIIGLTRFFVSKTTKISLNNF